MTGGKRRIFSTVLAALIVAFAVLSLSAATLLTAQAFNIIFIGLIRTETLAAVWPFSVSIMAVLAAVWAFEHIGRHSATEGATAAPKRRRLPFFAIAATALLLLAAPVVLFAFFAAPVPAALIAADGAPAVETITLTDGRFKDDFRIREDVDTLFAFEAGEAGEYVIDVFGFDPETDPVVSAEIDSEAVDRTYIVDDDAGVFPHGARIFAELKAGETFRIKTFAYAVAPGDGDNATMEIHVVNAARLLNEYRANDISADGETSIFENFAGLDQNRFAVAGHVFRGREIGASDKCLIISVGPNPLRGFEIDAALYRTHADEGDAGAWPIAEGERGRVPQDPNAVLIAQPIESERDLSRFIVAARPLNAARALTSAGLSEPPWDYRIGAAFAPSGQSCEEYLQFQQMLKLGEAAFGHGDAGQ